jgi:hypothetical protein
MLICLSSSVIHQKISLHVICCFPLAEYNMYLSTACTHACPIYCNYTTWNASQTGRDLKTTPEISRSSRHTCLQLASCGGVFIGCEILVILFVIRLSVVQ